MSCLACELDHTTPLVPPNLKTPLTNHSLSRALCVESAARRTSTLNSWQPPLPRSPPLSFRAERGICFCDEYRPGSSGNACSWLRLAVSSGAAGEFKHRVFAPTMRRCLRRPRIASGAGLGETPSGETRPVFFPQAVEVLRR
jgi:hypothetical protein